jgi:DNA-binding response OmpR family regulator
MMRVVLVEDNVSLRDDIVVSLCAEGLEVIGVSGSTELFFELLQKPVDIIIMDIGLAGESGLVILQQLRSLKNQRYLGIIMLTGHFEMSCRIECLASGADAYLVKPVEIEELTAYIQNVYRRVNIAVESYTQLKWQFNHREWRLFCPTGAVIELSRLESEFLKLLVEHAGKPVKRKDIIAVAFKQDPVAYDSRRLEALVSRLRRKIYALYPLSQPIKAVHSIGYVFTDTVKAV